MNIKIKPLTKEHRKEVMDIFNYYVENSFAAYPENILPYEFFDKFLQMSQGYPAIIAEDENGQVLGFGMLRAYNPLSTFSQTAEITYFIKEGLTGKGLGKMMLDYLIGEGKKKGLTSVLANISSLNEGSINFHKKMVLSNAAGLRKSAKRKTRYLISSICKKCCKKLFEA